MNYFALNPNFAMSMPQSPQNFASRSLIQNQLVIRGKKEIIQPLRVPSPTALTTITMPSLPTKLRPKRPSSPRLYPFLKIQCLRPKKQLL